MANIARRLFVKILGAFAIGGQTACRNQSTADGSSDDIDSAGWDETYDYVVVGSGAGGGPLASNLARRGFSVALLEAGEDRGETTPDGKPALNYQVPAFHTQSTEDKSMRWDFFVKHYDDDARRESDSKYTSDKGGVLYPRAGTLGGCTAHNAMITVYPHERDWEEIARIAELEGDTSWSPANMRRYFKIMEKCGYLDDKGVSADAHGFSGWLPTHRAASTLILGDGKLEGILLSAARIVGGFLGTIGQLLDAMNADLNAAGPARDSTEGMFTIPLATDGKKRRGPREFIVETVALGHPLTIRQRMLVSRVLFDAQLRAQGVECLEGAHLYRADPDAPASGSPGKKKTIRAKREVILSAGAFNTPQILKLSGIGPKEELAALDIPVRLDRPGVGANLQDRYEVGVISKFGSDFKIIDGCTFGAAGDPCLTKWNEKGGVYATNGAVVGIAKKSSPKQPVCDLFIFGLPSFFKGYEPGYSLRTEEDHRHFTWAILKAHTKNQAGVIKLRSTDPRDVPDIRFRYFDEGTNDAGQAQADLDAVTQGVEVARKINARAKTLLFLEDMEEVAPGAHVTGAALDDFVKREAWGHHASCTCKIGAADDPMAVLDSKFQVRGTRALRVVDASIFPKIPGFFIVVPIYMVSEKATDDILAAAGKPRA